jgi:linoleoyl-CoA desaturase
MVNKTQGFSETLFSRADNYFQKQRAGRYANHVFYIKAFILLLLYGLSYYLFISQAGKLSELLFLSFVLGLLHVFIPVNISHDAIHQAVSSRRWLNRLMLYGFEITGSNSFMYGRKHLEAHYNKENGSKSVAIESQGLLLQKHSNEGKKNLPVIFYLLYSQYMIFFRDFSLFFSGTSVPRAEWIKLFFFKTVYFIAFLVIPFIFIPLPWWQILISLLFMYLFVTAFLVIILLMPTEKMEVSRKTATGINDQWLIEILEHNVDFSPSSRILNLIAGGANLNVVHYLFHSVNHVHYNKLAEIIETTAAEFGLAYRKQQVKDVFGIHFNYLKNIQSSNS